MEYQRVTAEPPNETQPLERLFLNETLSTKVALVREARELFGKVAAQRVWDQLGLPHPTASSKKQSILPDIVRRFLNEATVPAPGKELTARAMHRAYISWARAKGCPPLSAQSLGKICSRMGMTRRKSGSTIYLDIDTRPSDVYQSEMSL
jgi:hypothetical protein